MDAFFNWLSGGTPISIAFILVIFVAVGALIAAFLVALRQGREISIWPQLKIGPSKMNGNLQPPETNGNPKPPEPVNRPNDGLSTFHQKRQAIKAREAVLRDAVSRILRGDSIKSITSNSKIFTIGDRFPVPSFDWVTVMNLEPIRNANSEESFGGSCGINENGSVEILGFFEDNGEWKALLRYHLSEEVAGALCPDGILFFKTL